MLRDRYFLNIIVIDGPGSLGRCASESGGRAGDRAERRYRLSLPFHCHHCLLWLVMSGPTVAQFFVLDPFYAASGIWVCLPAIFYFGFSAWPVGGRRPAAPGPRFLRFPLPLSLLLHRAHQAWRSPSMAMPSRGLTPHLG